MGTSGDGDDLRGDFPTLLATRCTRRERFRRGNRGKRVGEKTQKIGASKGAESRHFAGLFSHRANP